MSQPLIPNKWCLKACICGNKSSQIKNMRNYFCLAVSYYLMQDSFFITSSLNGV
ncbi:hypothetical protein HMPREF1345_00661 [Enterococcus faecium TX1337RF]|nr:hypothetical protein HMPREF1345_00661 [Enterococcus faecium TX1337RF]